jgi:methionyl aminopeptidase
MIIQNKGQESKIKEAGLISTEILKQSSKIIDVGIYPIEIDNYILDLCKKNKVKPAFYGVKSGRNRFPANSCISVNDEMLHAIPSSKRKLQKGDIIKIDFGIIFEGLYTDQCFTFVLKEVTPDNKRLVNVARQSTENALSRAIVGSHVGDLGNTMHSTAKLLGYDVLKMFVGHGIGLSLHDEPQIPAYGRKGTGEILENGMVICIESQVKYGNDEVYIENDGWTVKSVDGTNGAMFEYMVIVREGKPEILTPMLEWKTLV